MRGKFIVIEGIDGAGLSTQAMLLETWLRSMGKNTLLTKEPTHGMVGGLIRAALAKEWKASDEVLQLLFVADRLHHLQTTILPALRQGRWVICDRYFFSTLAYGKAAGLDGRWLRQLNEGFPLPHLLFILDLPPKEAIERLRAGRESLTLYEELIRFRKVRDAYIGLSNEYKKISFLIDATKSPNEVHERIKYIVTRKLFK